jgi:hypothetical protein
MKFNENSFLGRMVGLSGILLAVYFFINLFLQELNPDANYIFSFSIFFILSYTIYLFEKKKIFYPLIILEILFILFILRGLFGGL